MERPEGEKTFAANALPWVRRAVSLAIVAYIVWRLTHFGWDELLANLPQNPAFYAVQLLAYAVLPVCEIVIFSKLFGYRLWTAWAVMLRKRALNNSVIGYSGEAYLVFWAKDRLGMRRRDALSAIKDNVLLSGFTTAAFAILAAGTLLAFHPVLLDANAMLATGERPFVVFAVLFVVALVAGHFFRKRLFGIAGAMIGLIIAIHATRLVINYSLQMLQWDIGIPAGSLTLWFTLATVQLVISQLPLLPNRDLLFLAFILEFAPASGVDPAALRAMILAIFLLYQLCNYTVLLATTALPSARAFGRAEGEPA